jgi:hypothetical protein
MSDTGTSKAQDLTAAQHQISPGLAIGWRCPMCALHRSTLGRRKRFTKAWGPTMVCAHCVKGMSK